MRAFPFIVFVTLILVFGQTSSAAWWNTAWSYAIAIDVNTTVASNLTNFPAKVSLSTSNSTLWNTTTCTNVRFVDTTNTTSLLYDLDSSAAVFCGNATNNATFWVLGNWTGGALNRIYAYLGNIAAASGENEVTVWRNANYIGVYHMNENTTGTGANNGINLIDSAAYNNMTTNWTKVNNDAPPKSDCPLMVNQIGYAINFTGACAFTSDTATGYGAFKSAKTQSVWTEVNAYSNNEPIMGIYNSGETREWVMKELTSGQMAMWNFGTDLTFTPYLSSVGYEGYASLSFDGTQTHSAYNGSTSSTGTFALQTGNAAKVQIGNLMFYNEVLNGMTIAEARFRNETSTADWLTSEAKQTASIGQLESNWWNTSYSYRIRVGVSNWFCNAAFCQFPIYLGLNASVTNGSDIRIPNANNSGLLSFWREDGWNYTNASGYLWVNASNQTTVVYIYYGLASATDVSNVDNTFVAGDDFNGQSTLNLTKWNNVSMAAVVSNGVMNLSYPAGNGGVILKSNLSTTLSYSTYFRSTKNTGHSSNNKVYWQDTTSSPGTNPWTYTNAADYGEGESSMYTVITYSGSTNSSGPASTIGVWYRYQLVSSNTAILFTRYTDKTSTALLTVTASGTVGSGYASNFYGLGGCCSRNNAYDFFVVTPGSTVTPSFAIGTQEIGAGSPPAATYTSMIGNATHWVWATLQTGNITISGNATEWTWRTWSPGSGRMIRNGSATSWTWVAE